MARSIYTDGVQDTRTLGSLEDEEKLKVLHEIGSNDINCLSNGKRGQRTASMRLVNEKILQFVYSNCWCMKLVLEPYFEN